MKKKKANVKQEKVKNETQNKRGNCFCIGVRFQRIYSHIRPATGK